MYIYIHTSTYVYMAAASPSEEYSEQRENHANISAVEASELISQAAQNFLASGSSRFAGLATRGSKIERMVRAVSTSPPPPNPEPKPFELISLKRLSATLTSLLVSRTDLQTYCDDWNWADGLMSAINLSEKPLETLYIRKI